MAKRKQVKNKRKAAILDELNKAETIYMFGGNPVYKHSNQEYAKVGIKTAGIILKNGFERAKNDALAEAKAQIAYYEQQEKNLVTKLGMSTEELLKEINTQALGGAGENTTLANLGALMLNTKALATKASNISTSRDKMRQATHKIGGLDLTPDQMVDLNKTMRTQLWDSFNEFVKSSNYLESEEFKAEVDKAIDKYFTKSENNRRFKAKSAYTQFQRDLGTMWELSVAGKTITRNG